MNLGPNDLMPCPSDGARRRHQARAEHCDVCGTEGRRVLPPSLSEVVARRRERLARAASATPRARLALVDGEEAS